MGAQAQGADATTGRWVVIPRTLVLVFEGDDVLLMKRGAHRRIFPNKYNGLGGHVERDEHPGFTEFRRAAEQELHRQERLAATGVSRNQRRAARGQSAAGDLVQPLDAGGRLR